MKKIFVLIFYLVLNSLILPVKAQKDYYIPIVNSDNAWSILADYSAGGGDLESFYLKIEDTIVFNKDKSYHKVYLTYDTVGLEDNWSHIGFISEDTLLKKCYFRDLESNEGLIYDYSANEGDTLHLWNTMHSNDPVDALILEKDSVYLGDNYRDRLEVKLLPWGIIEEWIEGVGSTKGLLFSGYTILGANYSLLCFFENDELVYHLEGYPTCYYGNSTEVNRTIENDLPLIFPNPIKSDDGNSLLFNSLILKINQILNIYIFDLSGQCVHQDHILMENVYYQLPILNEGTYIIKICTKNEIYSEKIQIY